jgi:hypothetical protein
MPRMSANLHSRLERLETQMNERYSQTVIAVCRDDEDPEKAGQLRRAQVGNPWAHVLVVITGVPNGRRAA